jgi:E3 ubiquitin-protein ligase ZNF598
VGDTVLLLRYNCPDGDCDFAGLGWPDLHRHVKSAHKKRMCDLCTRNKRVFTHEHELFADKELEKHMRRGDDKPGAADQTGFKGHPLCGFCGERFYDDDKLYDHCRMKHERCFLCDRRDSRHPHYYRDYNALEEHFRKDHFLCADRECQEKKFVVFDTELDLQGHQLAEHGGKTTGRDARLVDISGFDIRQSYQPERRGGEGRTGRDGRGGRGREGRGRGRDQNADIAPATTPQALRRDEIAFQRQMAIHSAQSVANRTFGGQLSTPVPSATPSGSRGNSQPTTPRPTSSSANPMESSADPSTMGPEERARLVRHGAVIERAANLLGNDSQKMVTFRDHISTYRKGVFSGPQLIDAFFTLFSDTTSGALGTLVKEVAELFEDKKKADALRAAWQDWRAINEDYPSLPGLSGMHGATSSSSGWANASAANPAQPGGAPSQKHSNRVLKLKNSTRLGGPTPTSGSSSRWTGRPAVAPPSSSAFPSLPSGGSSRASSSTQSWSAGNQAQTAQSSSSSSTSYKTRPTQRAPTGGDAFPALPQAPKPKTTIWGYGTGRGVRRDHGNGDTGFQWGTSAATSPSAEEPPETNSGAKKGGKKGKKQVLVQWG